jgi:hypothetical protein
VGITEKKIYRRGEPAVIGRTILVMVAIADLNGVMAAPGYGPGPRGRVEKLIECSAGSKAFR